MFKTALILAFVLVFACAQNCTQTKKCVGLNGDCKPNTECDPKPANATCCAAGLLCVSGKCTNNNIGKKCSNQGECIGPGSAGVMCKDEKCVANMLVGDSCEGDYQCLPNVKCESKKCVGKAKGQTCTASTECDYGLYCKVGGTNSTCEEKLAVDAACDGTVPCIDNAGCLDKKCVALFSLSADDACDSTLEYCAPGLFCDNKKCKKGDSSPFIKECTKNDECSKKDGWTCGPCNSNTGKRYCVPGANSTRPVYCGKEGKNLIDCLVKSKCSLASVGTDANSCGYSKCKGKINAATACACSAFPKSQDCVYFSTCNAGLETWAIILLIVGGLIVVVLIVVALTRVCGGDEYQSID